MLWNVFIVFELQVLEWSIQVGATSTTSPTLVPYVATTPHQVTGLPVDEDEFGDELAKALPIRYYFWEELGQAH